MKFSIYCNNLNYTKAFLSFFVLITFSLLSACSPTKHLGEGQRLLTENDVEIIEGEKNDAGFESGDLTSLIRPKPNSTLLGYRLYTRLYNMASEKKAKRISDKKNKKCEAKNDTAISKIDYKIKKLENERKAFDEGTDEYKKYSKKLKLKANAKFSIENEACKNEHWTRKVGEAPVIYKTNDRYRTIRQMRIFLKNKGYYNAQVNDSVNFDDYFKVKWKRQFKKEYKSPYAKVIYKINPGTPFRIDTTAVFNCTDSLLQHELESGSNTTTLLKDVRLDTEIFQAERSRIENKLRSLGYYKFSKEYISYSVDTLAGNYTARITINISSPADVDKIDQNHKKYKLNNVFIFTDFEPKPALTNTESYFASMVDSLYIFDDKYPFIFRNNGLHTLSYKSVARGTYLYKDSLFNFQDVKDSYRYLSSLKVVKIANINFIDSEIQPDSADFGLLDCELRLTQGDLQSFQAEITGTNTSGNIGAAGNLIYQHRNLFHNGEVLDLNVKLALERQTSSEDDIENIDIIEEAQDFFNSSEKGIEMALKFPRLLSPIKLRSFNKRVTPTTEVSLVFNNLVRTDYTRTIAGMSFGYSWNSSSSIRHFFQPITFDLINLKDPSDEFLKYINDYRLEESYEDHLILGLSYSLTVNNQVKKDKRNPSYIRLNVKNAGLILDNVMKVSGAEKVDDSYHIFETAFAQFIKTDIDYRYFQRLDRFKDKLVLRAFAGAVLPYGNSNSVPFGEKYFSGGANGIRAWQVRTVGPGSYQLRNSKDTIFPNQTADIKLETNFEYRFKLFWTAEGAIFVDAGNIWAINDTDDRDDAQFFINEFYKQIAVGTGFGLRLDFDFFIIRTDIGIKLREPYKTDGHNFIPGNRSYNSGDWTFNVGIGYPF